MVVNRQAVCASLQWSQVAPVEPVHTATYGHWARTAAGAGKLGLKLFSSNFPIGVVWVHCFSHLDKMIAPVEISFFNVLLKKY